jgi:hypothetical protein
MLYSHMPLRIAKGFALPDDGVTQTYGFIARKGAGKTYAAGRLVEELLTLGAPVIVIDPVGNWYGLQVGRDGRSPGFAIPVFGGEHANVPIAVDQGEALARLLVPRQLAAIVDVSGFRKNERKRFVAEFAEALFHAAKRDPTPRTIVFEEAQVFAPQRERGAERLLGAVEDIVRLGRNYGLGSVLITQRPQSVNKEVLNQVEALFVGQLSGPHERRAIAQWVAEHEAGRELLDDLPSLPVGTMVLWSPQWLRTLQKVKIERKRTFDASATPEFGGTRQSIERQSSIDAAELAGALASLAVPPIARVIDKKKPPESSLSASTSARVVALEAEVTRLRPFEARCAELQRLLAKVAAYSRGLEEVTAAAEKLRSDEDPRSSSAPHQDTQRAVAPSAGPRRTQPARAAGAAQPDGNSEGLRAGALRMLTVLATFYPGVMTKSQIARAAKMRVTSGTFSTYWGRLKQLLLLEEAESGLFRVTPRGLEMLGSGRPEVPRTFAERRAFWEARLRAGERRLLDEVIRVGAVGITRVELAAATQMSATSGTFSTYIGALHKNRLVAREGERYVVHPWLLRGPGGAP